MFTGQLPDIGRLPPLPEEGQFRRALHDMLDEQGKRQFASRTFNRFMSTYVRYPRQADMPEINRRLPSGETVDFRAQVYAGLAINGDIVMVTEGTSPRGRPELFAATTNLYENDGYFREWFASKIMAHDDMQDVDLERLTPAKFGPIQPHLKPHLRLLLDNGQAWLVDGLVAGAELAVPLVPAERALPMVEAYFEARIQPVAETALQHSAALLPV